MNDHVPAIPANSFRVVLNLDYPEKRMDSILLQALRDQNDNAHLKAISRNALKELFAKGKILTKGQRARPSSSLAKGTTYIDILL